MWILLVEDEKSLANSIRRGLEEEGYVVEVCHDGENAELLGIANDYDLVILDWRLPGKDGRRVLESWRNEGRSFPVLMLTALGDIDHKVSGLDSGADDYMSKPFSFEELLARIRALSRRNSGMSSDKPVEVGAVELDGRRRRVKVCGDELELRPKEFALLELLINNQETVLTKTQIAERVWGTAYYVSDNVIEVTVSTLRQKLKDAAGACLPSEQLEQHPVIETVRGVGYRFDPTVLNTN